jgi:hypothetical protein
MQLVVRWFAFHDAQRQDAQGTASLLRAVHAR